MRRPNRRLALLLVLPLLAGAAAGAAWIARAGGLAFLRSLGGVRPLPVALLAGGVVLCLLLRSLRWQYLLRRAGVRIPARRSLTIFLASLVGIATPAHVGEALRAPLARLACGVPVRLSLALLVAERLLDVAALAAFGGAASGQAWLLATAAGGLAAAWATGALLARAEARSGAAPGPAAALAGPRTWLVALAGSLLAWLPAAPAVGLAATSVGVALPWADAVASFARATLAGGVSLLPAGVAATGSVAVLDLERAGADPAAGLAAVSVFRMGTAGLTLVVAGAALAAELRRLRRREPHGAGGHFAEIADEYLDQFSAHVFGLLFERRLRLLCEALPPPAEAGRGLDLGCGLGLHLDALRGRGYRVVGVDAAPDLVRRAGRAAPPAAAATALALPFADGSFDFVYTIGVLHHVGGPDAQRRAVDEVRRVLRRGGRLLVQETNPRNPLFRLYMGYVFPILRSIDEGTETWIWPDWWGEREGFEVVRLRYFTFLPDFLPRGLTRLLLALERRLERSALRGYSVHYAAELRAAPAAPRAAPPG